jgi:D-alanyl-D-alanine carboxypeptidase (penicillin-binding protein 5/6)
VGRVRALAASLVASVVASALAPVAFLAVAAGPAAAYPLPRAWILVDAGTGDVLAASNDHVSMPPASLVKLLTAVVAVEDLAPDAQVPVDATAAAEPPSAIGMRAGQVWGLSDALHCLLMASANDVAVALAERVGGSVAGFANEMQRWARVLGLRDHPVLDDPSGLDGAGHFGRGDLVSAYDLAIVARAVLAIPELAQIVAEKAYDFVDPSGTPRHLVNHNQLLFNPLFGAVGLKTGFTDKAGITYAGAARRAGRTLVVIQLGAYDHYVTAAQQLDWGFAVPPGAESAADQLPAVHLAPLPPHLSLGAPPAPAAREGLAEGPAPGSPGRAGDIAGVAAAGLLGGSALAVWSRPRRRRGTHARRRGRRPRRGRPDAPLP